MIRVMRSDDEGDDNEGDDNEGDESHVLGDS